MQQEIYFCKTFFALLPIYLLLKSLLSKTCNPALCQQKPIRVQLKYIKTLSHRSFSFNHTLAFFYSRSFQCYFYFDDPSWQASDGKLRNYEHYNQNKTFLFERRWFFLEKAGGAEGTRLASRPRTQKNPRPRTALPRRNPLKGQEFSRPRSKDTGASVLQINSFSWRSQKKGFQKSFCLC